MNWDAKGPPAGSLKLRKTYIIRHKATKMLQIHYAGSDPHTLREEFRYTNKRLSWKDYQVVEFTKEVAAEGHKARVDFQMSPVEEEFYEGN